MANEAQKNIQRAEMAARSAAFVATKDLLDADPKVSALLASSLASDMARQARETSESDPLKTAASYYYYRQVEQRFFLDGWDGDTTVQAFSTVRGFHAVYEIFYEFLLDEERRQLIAEGLLTENEDGKTQITGKGIRFYENDLKKEQSGRRKRGRKGCKKQKG